MVKEKLRSPDGGTVTRRVIDGNDVAPDDTAETEAVRCEGPGDNGGRRGHSGYIPGTNVTVRQGDVLRSIVSMRRAMGVPPTVREIGKELGLSSTNGVTEFLEALELKGMTHRPLGPGVSRGWMQTDEGEALASRLIDERNAAREVDAA